MELKSTVSFHTRISTSHCFPLSHAVFILSTKKDGSYEELLKNPEVDIAYVGNLHAFRRATGEMCLLANKHVLLEKPFTCSVVDAEYLIGLAKERNLFLMEVRNGDVTQNDEEKMKRKG